MNIPLETVFLIIIAVGISASYAKPKGHETTKRENPILMACKGNNCPSPKTPKTLKSLPRSCLHHLRSGAAKCGIYKIFNNAGNGYPVYCDMKTEPGMAWTLVMSWSTKHRGLKEFRSSGFQRNAPVNENSPNWKLYRQTLTRMHSLKSHSTHWRATCSYPTHGVDYTDYVRANFKDFNIMAFRGSGTCKKVELVNVRGHLGIQLTSRWWQAPSTSLHLDSSHRGCQFVPVKGAVSSEDNFGYYGVINPKFRCTASPSSTTQWWFGGYL